MDIVHPQVAGIDVHKRVVWVAVRLPGGTPGERKVMVRSFTHGGRGKGCPGAELARAVGLRAATAGQRPTPSAPGST